MAPDFCTKCMKTRMVHVSTKCADMCSVEVQRNSSIGYVPSDLGIGGGDYLHFSYCLHCGHIHGQWPLKVAEIEQPDGKEEEPDER